MAVADAFLEMARRDGKSLTQMQLQKLVYIAHGWNLAVNNRPLTTDALQAWEFGPVYPALWDVLRQFGRDAVTHVLSVDNAEPTTPTPADLFDADEKSVIAKVYEIYGHFHAFQLSAMTHKAGTPWCDVFEKQQNPRGAISDAAIKTHFVDIATAAKTAA
jgi:uncharacterized phage-associated protein